MERFSLDYSLCMEERLGSAGLPAATLEDLRARLESAQRALVERRRKGGIAWADLPGQDPAGVLAFAEEVRDRFDNLLVLGIGGSALGTVALCTALLHPYHNTLTAAERGGVPRIFVVDNVDPDQISALLSHLDLSSTLVNVISKSGTTAETMAAYLIVRGLLQGRVPRLQDHLVFTTDPKSGVLREIGEQEGIALFDIPPGVGGRFSVLSAVGLLPAAVVGIDVPALLAGALDADRWIAETDVLSNPAYLCAALQYLMDTCFGRRLSVMMPYSARLRDVADWYRQLWAESLGKAVNREGEEVHVGPTPIKALGATDQHSQVQLYSEGPDDKVITFLRVEQFDSEAVIPSPHPQLEPLAYLGGHSLGELLNAEQEATAWALAENGRPSLTITLPRVSAESVGGLMFMLEMATAISGELYNIDAFDQPGVELGKKAAYGLMGRSGYEELAAKIRRRQVGSGPSGEAGRHEYRI